LVVVFAALGCAPAQSGEQVSSGARKVVTFDGGEITQNEVVEVVEQQAGGQGADVRPGSEAFEASKASAAQQLLQVELVRAYAEDNGIETSEDEVDAVVEEELQLLRDQVAQQAQAQGQNPDDAFQQALEANNLTEEQLRRNVEEQVRQQDVALVREVQADVSGDAQPTEAEVRDYYDQNHEAQFTKQATRCIRHILFNPDQERRANDVKEQLEDGGNFGDLAKEFSQDPGSAEQGGDLGCVPRGQFVEEFDKAAFEAEEGEIVGPVETEFGFHLIEVTEIREESETPFREVRSDIEDQLVSQNESAGFETWFQTESERRNVKYLPGYDPSAPQEGAGGEQAAPEGEAQEE
jgi:parvulin-like peptidyl-prolyl isomerase